MENNQSSVIHMELREDNILYAQLDFPIGSGNDCLLDQNAIPLIHILEKEGRLYAEGFSNAGVSLNGKKLFAQVLLQSGDLFEVPQGRYVVTLTGERVRKTPKRNIRLLSISVLLLLAGLAWFFLSGKSGPDQSTRPKTTLPEPHISNKPPSLPPIADLFRNTTPQPIPIPAQTPDAPLPSSDVPQELLKRNFETPLGCVAVSPGGRLIAVGAGDGSIRLLDSISGQETSIFSGHKNSVSCLAFSPNGKYLLSGSYDRTLRWWDLESKKELFVMSGHTGQIRCAAISLDGTRAVSGGMDGTVMFWDLNSGKELNWFFGHVGMVNSVVFAPDGRRAFSGGIDATVRVWKLSSGKELDRLTGDLTGVNVLALSPNGKILLSGADGFRPGPQGPVALGIKTLRGWDPVRGKDLSLPIEMNEWITSLRFSINGKYIVAGTGGDPALGSTKKSHKPWVRVFRTADWKQINAWQGHNEVVSGVAFFPDNERIVSVGVDGLLCIWTLSDK